MPHALHPTPNAPHPTPHTQRLTPHSLTKVSTQRPTPHAPTPYTQRPTPNALHPTPYTQRPTPNALHPTPYTLHSTPYTCSRLLGESSAYNSYGESFKGVEGRIFYPLNPTTKFPRCSFFLASHSHTQPHWLALRSHERRATAVPRLPIA
jgi:hypothetical protein